MYPFDPYKGRSIRQITEAAHVERFFFFFFFNDASHRDFYFRDVIIINSKRWESSFSLSLYSWVDESISTRMRLLVRLSRKGRNSLRPRRRRSARVLFYFKYFSPFFIAWTKRNSEQTWRFSSKIGSLLASSGESCVCVHSMSTCARQYILFSYIELSA